MGHRNAYLLLLLLALPLRADCAEQIIGDFATPPGAEPSLQVRFAADGSASWQAVRAGRPLAGEGLWDLNAGGSYTLLLDDSGTRLISFRIAGDRLQPIEWDEKEWGGDLSALRRQ